MKPIFKLLLTLFIYLASHSAFAVGEKVLFLTTNETVPDGVNAIDSARVEFQKAGAVITERAVLNTSGGVTSAIFTAVDGGQYDIVLIISVYAPIDLSNWTVINNAIATNKAASFVMFIDACCERDANAKQMANALDLLSTGTISLGADIPT